jgi:hypothetical protein
MFVLWTVMEDVYGHFNWCLIESSALSFLFCITKCELYTGHFIMFFMITSIYNKKTKGPTLMELFTAIGKLKKFFFWQLEMFDVCTTGDTAHTDTIFKFLPHTRQHWDLNIISMCAVSPVVHTPNTSSCQKKLFQFFCGCEQFH